MKYIYICCAVLSSTIKKKRTIEEFNQFMYPPNLDKKVKLIKL